jgi:hypothetical protein
MASAATVITRGYGSFGSASLVVTRGYGLGQVAAIVMPYVDSADVFDGYEIMGTYRTEAVGQTFAGGAQATQARQA